MELPEATQSRKASRGGRRPRAQKGGAAAPKGVPYISRAISTYELVSEEGLSRIEDMADRLLHEVGVDFRDDAEALDIWRQAGADVDGERVRMEPGMARRIIQANAPREFTQAARDPAKSIRIGGNNLVFVPNYGSPFVHDLDGGRRYGTMADFDNLVRLAQASPWMHHSGGTVCEPVDVPVSKRHLDMVYSHIKFSDKPFMGSVTAGSRAEDSVEMAKILFGADFVAENCCLINIINVNSPLVLDDTMLAAMKVYARNNQAVIVTPFILTGAMGPVTQAAAAAQMLAEAMAGMAFAQLVNPGCPVILGNFTSSMSMRTGAPTFGMPEPALGLLVAGQLARRLGVPLRGGGSLTSSKLPDAQAAQESADTLMPAILGGVNLMMQSAGWLEGGLTVGYEKFVMDCDHLGMMHRFTAGLDLAEAEFGLDAFKEVGPGNHFLGCEHTQERFKTAFYDSSINCNKSFEQWSEEGSLDAAWRANAEWKRMLAEFEEPALDPAIDEALQDFIARRKEVLPDTFE